MAKKSMKDSLRIVWTEKVAEWLKANGEDVLRVGSNEVAIPVVDSDGNEDFVIVTVRVPIGSRDGDSYDGYSMAEDYAMKVKEKEEKKKEAEAQKQKKKEKDAKAREEKKRLKEEKKKKEEADAEQLEQIKGEDSLPLIFKMKRKIE